MRSACLTGPRHQILAYCYPVTLLPSTVHYPWLSHQPAMLRPRVVPSSLGVLCSQMTDQHVRWKGVGRGREVLWTGDSQLIWHVLPPIYVYDDFFFFRIKQSFWSEMCFFSLIWSFPLIFFFFKFLFITNLHPFLRLLNRAPASVPPKKHLSNTNYMPAKEVFFYFQSNRSHFFMHFKLCPPTGLMLQCRYN